MADISITAGSVLAGVGAIIAPRGIAGATITAGQWIYYDPADDRYKLADNNSATALARIPTALALNGASSGQPVAPLLSGPVTIGGTLVAGVAYYLSDTPGGMCPVADVGSGETSVFLGMATSTTVLDVAIKASGVTL